MTPAYRFHLYYAGCADKQEMIGVAMSNDLKEWWRPESNPIIPCGAADAFDSAQTSNPCVVETDDGLTMIYQAKDRAGVFRFGLARSKDGVQWQRFPQPILSIPVDTDPAPYREGVQHPHLVKLGAGWRLYFVECRSGKHRLRFAESPDLDTFQVSDAICLEQETRWESFAIYYPWILHAGDEWTMWYSAVESRDGTRVWHLARAVSEDGIRWRRSPGEPIMSGATPLNRALPGRLLQRTLKRVPFGLVDRVVGAGTVRTMNVANPSVARSGTGNKLTMYYHAVLPDGGYAIGRMQSDDGVAWREREDLVLGQRPAGWEHDFNADPFLLALKPARTARATTPEFEAVRRLLDQVPIERGSDLWVHSALRRLGGRNAQPRKIIDYLLDRIGPEGTLLMPMFPMPGSTADYIRAGQPFDPRTTRTTMGVLPNVLFDEFPIERSLYPWTSVGALGPRATEYTSTHHLSPWPMGKLSPFYKLFERRGKVLLLGVGWERNSNLHIVESIREDAYPYKTFEDGVVTMQVVHPQQGLIPVAIKMPLRRKKSTDWNAWGNTLARMYGFQQRFTHGSLACLFIDAEGMLQAIERGLDAGIYPYTPEFTPEMRKTWPLIRLGNLGKKAIRRLSGRVATRHAQP